PTVGLHAIGLLAIGFIVVLVYARAVHAEGYSLRRFGLRGLSWSTPLLAIALTGFFVLVFGPIAYWALDKTGAGSFRAGIATLGQLPTPYLVLAIVIVASAEELLYRAYAVERLADLTGSYFVAGVLSVLAFGLAHVPTWGWGPAATTIFSGAIVTMGY